MWFTKPITSAGVREDKSLVPGVDSEAARFGSQVLSSGRESVASRVEPTCIREHGSEVGIWGPRETPAFRVSWELQNIYTWEAPARGAGTARCSPWQLLPVTNVFMNVTALIGLLRTRQKP